MNHPDIFQRELAGEPISLNDPEYPKILALITEAQRTIAEMNTGYHDPAAVRDLFGRLTGTEVDESFWLLPPFYSDFGKNIRVGKNVFINHACEFMDRGGISIGDDVLIGPKVNLITLNHPLDPATRRSTSCAPILIRKGAWLGAGVSVMPGVTIGENAVVAANAVVTSDVPDNVVVGGIPARVIRHIGAAVLGTAVALSAADADDGRADAGPGAVATASQERLHMWMTVGTRRFAITLEDNPSAHAFTELLPATLDMAELNGNEKHASLPRSLPTDAIRPGTIRVGDVLLYGNDTLVVFYKTFSSPYSYTRIGRIEDTAALGKALGPGNARVAFTVR